MTERDGGPRSGPEWRAREAEASDETVTVALITAILYAARFQRRVPESEAEKRRTIADALADARLVVELVGEGHIPAAEAEPEQPPPSPGTIGRRPEAEAKATRRRG
jgi:hypothetical protein